MRLISPIYQGESWQCKGIFWHFRNSIDFHTHPPRLDGLINPADYDISFSIDDLQYIFNEELNYRVKKLQVGYPSFNKIAEISTEKLYMNRKMLDKFHEAQLYYEGKYIEFEKNWYEFLIENGMIVKDFNI
jgi:hypothetical protein